VRVGVRHRPSPLANGVPERQACLARAEGDSGP
jgi:hypothetical protein